MKKSVCLFLLCAAFALISCDPFTIPNDFPFKEFYSYTPYSLGDQIRFYYEKDTVTYIVNGTYSNYRMGGRYSKYGKEIAEKRATLIKANTEEGFELETICKDRADFKVTLCSLDSLHTINAKYEVDFTNEDIWSKSFDNSKIYRYFAPSLTLSQDGKETTVVRKSKGLYKFTDAEGHIWSIVE